VKREKPEPLAVPDQPNETWSMKHGARTSSRMLLTAMVWPLRWIFPASTARLKTPEPHHRMARKAAAKWLWTYNNDRPNMGIGRKTPAMKLEHAKPLA
jgi:transposase InsO family protein